MNNSSAEKTCPKCGAPIPVEAPLGLCPRCVLAGAATETDAGSAPALRHESPSVEAVRAAFPHLEVLGLIGAGGMGAVFRARQPKLDRLVALKVLAEPLGRQPTFAERFHREARVLARLNHPNIVSVFDFGEAGGFFYLLMEYVDGANLRQAMRAGRFTPAQALGVVPKICEALQFAHEHGILHRDIKPENILLDAKGRVKIADFGIAKLVGGGQADVTLTASGAALGTPAYMAPEQIEKPSAVDHRADIYSLGVVFYEMLTGELPLGRFAPPSQKTPLDARVDEIVLRALAKERELRQQSAHEVKTEVEGLTAAGLRPESARAGAVPAAGAEPTARDFILCNPRLPRMAQAITVYGLLVAPFLWALGLTLLDFEHLAAHPGAAMLEGMWLFFGDIFGGLATTIVLLVGALKLRVLRVSGSLWVRVAVWSRIALLVMGILVVTWAAVLDWDSEGTSARMSMGEGVVFAVSLLACGFEVAMLVWLRRNRAALRGLCLAAEAETAPHVGSDAVQLAPRISWKAVVGAVLSVPLWLQAVVVAAQGLVSLLQRDTALSSLGGMASMDASLGAVGGGLGLAGMILGTLALGELRRNPGRLRGMGAAIMGILGAPFGLVMTLIPGWILSLAATGYLSASVGRRLYEVAPLWLLGVLAVAVVRLKRWAERSAVPAAAGGEWRVALAGASVLVGLSVLLPKPLPPGKGVALKVSTPPRETFVVSALVSSNGVPVDCGELRAKLWPPGTTTASPYRVRWQPLEAQVNDDPGASWEIVVEDETSKTIAARLRPTNLPRLDWTRSPAADSFGPKRARHEAQVIELARALQTTGGGNAGAADWSVRLRLQSSPAQPTTARRGIDADFVLPANQAATFELVTRSNGVVVPVADLAAYFVNRADQPYTGKFLLADDPEDLDSLTALPRWKFGILGPDARRLAEGLAVPPLPQELTGNRHWSLDLWKSLEPDSEVIEGETGSDPSSPGFGLRIRTAAVAAMPGLRQQVGGFGTNWTRVAPPAIAANPQPPVGAVQVNLGVPQGQGVLIQMLTSTSNGVREIAGSAAYLLASPERDGSGIFQWMPAKERLTRTVDSYPWQIRMLGEQGAVLAAATNLTLPTQVARLVPSGGFSLDTGWLSPDEESTHWLVERSGPERPGLGIRLRRFAHHLEPHQLGEHGFAGTGTNWPAAFSPPPPARRIEPAPTGEGPWLRLTFTAVELRDDAGSRWLTMDHVEDAHGNCERAFGFDSDVVGFLAEIRKTSSLLAGEGSPPVEHQRIEWRLPDLLDRGSALEMRDRLAKEWIGRSIVLPRGQKRDLFALPVPGRGRLSGWVQAVASSTLK